MFRRLVLSAAAASAVSIAAASPVFAHIHTDPTEVQAGASATLGFIIGHGCDGSPTVEVSLQIPDGVTDAAPVELDGWDATVDDDEGVITFSGGSLPDGTQGTFEITMTTPATPDTMLWFPMVQRCSVGEYHWIELPGDDGSEPDSPAPGVMLFGPAVEPTPTAPATPDTTSAPTAKPEVTTPVTDPETSDPMVIATAPTTDIDGDDDGSNVGTIVFIAAVAAVLVVVGLLVRASRRAQAQHRSNADRTGGDAG